MKIAVAVVALLLAFGGRAASQTIPYDSLTVDSLVEDFGVTSAASILGAPDGAQATVAGSQFMAVMFAAGTEIVNFQKGSAVHVFWRRLTQDSAGADIEFVNLNPAAGFSLVREGPHIRVIQTGQVNAPQETTFLVPDTGYNALQISTAADTGAIICWIDAISLIQSGVAAVREPGDIAAPIMESYPNPFEHGSESKLEISSPATGVGELAIYDALGREIERIPAGELSQGASRELRIHIEHAGAFFARLMIDGLPVGAPLKLDAE